MSDKTTRRTFLTAVGAASITLAGCTSSGSEGPVGETVTNGNATGTITESDGTATTTSSGQFTRGEVLDDFEALDNWGTIIGNASADTESAYRGSQSVLVQNQDDSAGIFRTFTDGLDLTKNDLSVAMQLDAPAGGRLAVDLYAPGPADHAVARRFIPADLNGWIRFDIGYTNEPGTPDMTDVREVRFVVHPEEDGGSVKFRLDDLRMIPKPVDTGRVILTFDDSFASHYEVAFQELKDRGWSGVAATIPEEVGDADALTIGQLRRMDEQGWDIVSHPQVSSPVTPLPEMSKSDQRRVMEEHNNWLNLKGFSDGPNYFVTPFDRMGNGTYELVQEMYDLGFIFGACNNACIPTGRHIISRVYGNDDSLEGVWRQLKLAQRRNQLTVLAFHNIGENGDISVKNFRWLLNKIDEFDLEVLTASELAAEYE